MIHLLFLLLSYLASFAHEVCEFVVRALDTALQHSKLGRWTSHHSIFTSLSVSRLTEFSRFQASSGGLFSATDVEALCVAARRVAGCVTRAHFDMITSHAHGSSDRQERCAAVAGSAAMRACALPGCSAREQHVKHFKVCAACKAVVYCSREHQVRDWPSHKAACKAARNKADAAQQQQQPQPQKQ